MDGKTEFNSTSDYISESLERNVRLIDFPFIQSTWGNADNQQYMSHIQIYVKTPLLKWEYIKGYKTYNPMFWKILREKSEVSTSVPFISSLDILPTTAGQIRYPNSRMKSKLKINEILRHVLLSWQIQMYKSFNTKLCLMSEQLAIGMLLLWTPQNHFCQFLLLLEHIMQ